MCKTRCLPPRWRSASARIWTTFATACAPFDTSFFQSPGRTNVYNEHPFKVILDYAHNPASFARRWRNWPDRLEPIGRRTIVISVPGDRRDEDVRESVRACLPQFTHFVCKADNNRRGRGDDEIPQLVRKFLLEEGVDDANITVIARRRAGSRSLPSTMPRKAICWSSPRMT